MTEDPIKKKLNDTDTKIIIPDEIIPPSSSGPSLNPQTPSEKKFYFSFKSTQKPLLGGCLMSLLLVIGFILSALCFFPLAVIIWVSVMAYLWILKRRYRS